MVYIYIYRERNNGDHYTISNITTILKVLVTAFLGGFIYFKTGIKENGACLIEQAAIFNISFALFYTITTSTLFSVLAAVMVI